jgi:hypothetical protein
LFVIGAIVKAYTGTQDREQGYEIMKRFLSYRLEEGHLRMPLAAASAK